MRIRVLMAAFLVMGIATARAWGEDSGLIVHEWGVTIREQTAAGSVLSSPAELVSGLPAFVVKQKEGRTLQAQGWKKPVIWFQGTPQTKVSVKVMAEQGFATANFPAAELLIRRFSHRDSKAMMMSLLTEAAGFRWEGTLTKEPAEKVGEVAKDHWWQTARDAGGLYFNAKGSSERFIFYEASAFQEPTVTATLTAEEMALRNAYDAPSGQVIVLVNTGGKNFVRVVETIGAKAQVKLSKEEFFKEAGSAESVLSACAGQWKGFGMTEAESKAIAAVWREDLLKPQRLLLISRMPGKLYEAMFPLTIEPAPKEMIRVGMVFDALDGYAEAGSWIPELLEGRKNLAKLASGLSSGDYKEREQASRELEKLGIGARGVLAELVQSKDPEVKSRAEELLKKIMNVVPPAREGTDAGVTIQALR